MMTPEPLHHRTLPKTGTWMLLSSLFANFFLLGLLLAPMLQPRHSEPPFGPHGDALDRREDFVDHLTQGLSTADAAIIRAVAAKDGPLITGGRESMDAAMHEVTSALEKPAVDEAELQKALSDIASAHQKMQEGMSDLIHHAASDLTREGRQIFSQNGLKPPGPPHDLGMHRDESFRRPPP